MYVKNIPHTVSYHENLYFSHKNKLINYLNKTLKYHSWRSLFSLERKNKLIKKEAHQAFLYDQ